ncbi:hypothetical protein MPEAHAMD_4212 [Methylobacterium frigidaeris]|uniref:Uncharacterized protein n=1 Tax=Methylobacterium frigidaeris TaxID=2038277 RepID=A0AA37HDQ7_9HYPH|nr:hypothetical protein MPEAHAMD_4212 [Methylobacterium frigidaeris]
MTATDIVLCHPVRTAIGAYNGVLKGMPATELSAAAIRETLRWDWDCPVFDTAGECSSSGRLADEASEG